MAENVERSSASWRFPDIVFRGSYAVKEAHVLGTGLRVWQIVKLFRTLDEDAGATAAYFEIKLGLVEEALQYAAKYPKEIEARIERHNAALAERHIDSEGHAGRQSSSRR